MTLDGGEPPKGKTLLDQSLARRGIRNRRRGAPEYMASDCEGKPGYPNATMAFRAVRHRNHRKSKNLRTFLEPYRCPHCGQWHIGGKNG